MYCKMGISCNLNVYYLAFIQANCVKDLLAQALYVRCVAWLARKANTRSYATSESGQSTDSSDSLLPGSYMYLTPAEHLPGNC